MGPCRLWNSNLQGKSSRAHLEAKTSRVYGKNVTDLINRIVQILRRDLRQLRISAQDAELMEPVEPWDEG